MRSDKEPGMTTLSELNAADEDGFVAALASIYEHSPWIPRQAARHRPFASPAALKWALLQVVQHASEDEQLALIRAHPELAGKAAVAGQLTEASRCEQGSAGLAQCSPDEFETLQRLNREYGEKFGFPFILAVKGPAGKGLTRQEIIDTFARRLGNRADEEMAECLRQIHRIAELRLNDLLEIGHRYGHLVMDWADELAQLSESAEGLTCSYMTPTHQATARRIAELMQSAGLDTRIDAVGNVIGRYAAPDAAAPALLTGSHYDTVRNAGRYDGRLGILLPIAVARDLRERGEALPFHLDVVAFSEEEGVRFNSTFLGSRALTGQFTPGLLELRDCEGTALRDALQQAGHRPDEIPQAALRRENVLAFLEVHIEQGPVLLDKGLPLGVVTAIAGSSRYLVELRGLASHAGTTPMHLRRDAAAAAAEIVLMVERRCGAVPGLVGTVGQLQVPDGSVNVIPGRCRLSLDIRAADDVVRQAAVADVLHEIDDIARRRRIEVEVQPVLSAPAVHCAPRLMHALSTAIGQLGLPPFRLASGAGHDAMMMAALADVAMLFVRCGNGGLSHHPLETINADDAELAGEVLLHVLRGFNKGG
jgi:OHCU decarboxylase